MPIMVLMKRERWEKKSSLFQQLLTSSKKEKRKESFVLKEDYNTPSYYYDFCQFIFEIMK